MRGYQIIIVGDKKHTEVKGIKNRAGGKAIVISTIKGARKVISNLNKLAVVSQTTADVAKLSRIVSVLKDQCPDIKIENTICNAVQKMQSSAMELAKKKESIIIIGDTTSKNTTQLYEVSKKANSNTYLILHFPYQTGDTGRH